MSDSSIFKSLNIAVATISDSRDEVSDKSGAILREGILAAGHICAKKAIVPDDIYRIRALVSQWICDREIQVVVTTGGTGLTGRDGTPEAVAPLLDKEIEGFGELFRYLSFEEIGTATINSRCLAGVANGTYLFCLPGSRGACSLGWDKIIRPQLDATNKPCNLADLIPRLRET